MDEFDKWFPSASRQTFDHGGPRFRLVCFPSSGTMETLFTGKVKIDKKMKDSALMAWASQHNVEILSVQLPGRGKHSAPFLKSLSEVGSQIAPILKQKLSEMNKNGDAIPWAVLGHSMGCWAAYETIGALERIGMVQPPTSLIVACFAAPDITERPWLPNAGMDEAAFKQECRGWDIREQVLETPYIWDSFKTMLRGDFTLFDTYEMSPSAPLRQVPCPIYGCTATLDKRITETMVKGWNQFVAPGFAFHPMKPAEGTHLFLLDDVLKEQWFTESLLPILQTQLDGVAQVALPLPPVVAPVETSHGRAAEEPPRETKSKLRILCLHGFGCCDEILTIQTKRLRELGQTFLSDKQSVEYDFVSSPDEAMWDPESYEARLVTTFFANKANRQWMRRVSSDGVSTAKVETGKDGELIADNVRYIDWVGPLTFLLDYMKQHGPYDGVLGFSQGANVAVLLTALLESGAFNSQPAAMKFEFVVALCGSAFGWENQWSKASDVLPDLPSSCTLFQVPLKTKSLHFIGNADPFKAASQKLVTLFQGGNSDLIGQGEGSCGGDGSPVVHVFPSGHKPPTQKAAAIAFADFLSKQF